MSLPNKPAVPTVPVVDEWGFYDPDRAGLNALFERLASKAARLPAREEVVKVAAAAARAGEIRPPR